MIELPLLTGGEDPLWNSLLDVADRMPEAWTLIGGQMVLLHGLERDRIPPRVSEDLDLVVNARVRPPALPKMMDTLAALGFSSTGASPDGVAHRFQRGEVLIDVLAPDGLGEQANLVTIGGGVTISVAGGTYALQETSLVAVSHQGRTGFVPRPSLAGALVVKAGAARTDRGPSGIDRHLRDLAFLSSLVDDAIELRGYLGPKNRRRLRGVTALADQNNEAWILLGDGREEAYATWRVIADAD